MIIFLIDHTIKQRNRFSQIAIVPTIDSPRISLFVIVTLNAILNIQHDPHKTKFKALKALIKRKNGQEDREQFMKL